MIRSMTGFGSAGHEAEDIRAGVTARSLNHRFLDVTVHVPRRLQPLEGDIKDAVGRVVRRGRVELSLQATLAEGPVEEVVPSRPLVASLVRSLRDMQNEFGIEGGMSVSDLVRFPGALERTDARAALAPEARETLLGLVTRALEGLDAMRVAEGRRLREELERALEAVDRGRGPNRAAGGGHAGDAERRPSSSGCAPWWGSSAWRRAASTRRSCARSSATTWRRRSSVCAATRPWPGSCWPARTARPGSAWTSWPRS